MAVRGIRGAITVDTDQAEEILAATSELLHAMLESNPGLRPDDIAAAWFTVTEDLTSAFPPQAAREMGWTLVPMLSAREIPVPGSLPRCVRILLLWNTDLPPEAVHHVYLREAASLRPDWQLRQNLTSKGE
ncbi:MAG: chorismate mutase [Anaerolineales bacterium]|nr:chorismate mutase [Anaerolineales bacterium]